MSRRTDAHIDLQATIEAERASKVAAPSAQHDIARELMLLIEDHNRQTGDQESYCVRMAGGLLPRLVALGWVNPTAKPIDLILFCPICGTQHVDAANEAEEWTNPPHRSHKCHACHHIWRPADIATNGVLSISTGGAADDQPPIRGIAMCARGGA